MWSNIHLPRLTPHVDEIIGDNMRGFSHNRSNTNHILCSHKILEKNWEYNGVVHQQFIAFQEIL